MRSLSPEFPGQHQPTRPHVDPRRHEPIGMQHLPEEICLQMVLEEPHAVARAGEAVRLRRVAAGVYEASGGNPRSDDAHGGETVRVRSVSLDVQGKRQSESAHDHALGGSAVQVRDLLRGIQGEVKVEYAHATSHG